MVDFNKLLADMAFKAARPKMPFRVALTHEQAEDRERLINGIRMDSSDYFAAKKLQERIRDALAACQQANPDFNVELELEIEPEQCYIVVDRKQGVAWGQTRKQIKIGEEILCQFESRWWPRDEETFFKALRFYGVDATGIDWIPF